MNTPTRITLLYDGNCTGCTRAAQWFLAQEALLPLDAISLHDTALIGARFPGLAVGPDDFAAMAQFADGTFEAQAKGDGWWLALWSLKRFRPLAEKLDRAGMRPLARRAYALVAANRYWISRWLFGEKTVACRLGSAAAKDAEQQAMTCALPPRKNP